MTQKNMLKCWCRKCGRRLYTKREYIKQDDTCDICYKLNFMIPKSQVEEMVRKMLEEVKRINYTFEPKLSKKIKAIAKENGVDVK